MEEMKPGNVGSELLQLVSAVCPWEGVPGPPPVLTDCGLQVPALKEVS